MWRRLGAMVRKELAQLVRDAQMELMRKRAMLQHFSWLDAAKQYEDVYQKALLRRETWQ